MLTQRITRVVQQDERDQKIREALHEMAKPLARHADDDDMNKARKIKSS